jgi:hypothetical protein
MLRVARASRQGQPLRVANCPAPRRCCWGQLGGSNRANAGTRCSDHVPGLSPKEAATADLVNFKSGETGAGPGFFNESQMDHFPYLLLPRSHCAGPI